MNAERKSYIGSVLSVISKAGIRYKGTLIMIDSQNQTLTLQSVKSFGSEGRRGQGKEVPPSDDIYEYIIFKASDLKEFNVIQVPQKDEKSFQDPAIIQTQKKEDKTEERTEKEEEYRQKEEYYGRSEKRPAYHKKRRNSFEYKLKESEDKESVKEKYKDDFDFDTMNKKVVKGEVKIEPKYDKKKSFFDSITNCEMKNKRMDRSEIKKIDTETFGEYEVSHFDHSNRRGRRRRFGRGRGYRGSN
jgi:flagellar biosynthesis GTPase FlhF